MASAYERAYAGLGWRECERCGTGWRLMDWDACPVCVPPPQRDGAQKGKPYTLDMAEADRQAARDGYAP